MTPSRPVLTLLALGLAAGCGSSVVEDPAPPKTTPVGLLPRPAVDKPGGTTTFAADHVFLGSRLRSGAPSSKAWESYGFDLDGRTTGVAESAASTGVCRRADGSPSGIVIDGAGGVDNNVASQVLSVLVSLRPGLETEIDAQVGAGDWTWVLVLDDLGGDDDAKVPGRLYLGRKLPEAPTSTVDDRWPVTAEVTFPDGYTSKGTWVSGRASFALPLVARASIRLPLEGAYVTLDLADGKGTIAGAVRASALLSALTPALAQYGMCPSNPTYTQIADVVMESADLVADAPSLQDPTKACDALSLGFGFHASKAGAPIPGAIEPPAAKTDCK